MQFDTPGKSYEDMWELIYANLPQNSPFSLELLMAIAWEESLFNNKQQMQGTAWGFGQVEPSEYYKFQGPKAVYPVVGLPRVEHYEVDGHDKDGNAIKIKKARLKGFLNEQQGIQVEIACLMHNYAALGGKRAALEGYAGVHYKGTDVPAHLDSPGKRLAVVEGWLDCERHLQREFIPPKTKTPPKKGEHHYDFTKVEFYAADFPTFVKDGLHKARHFDKKSQLFDDVLFPKNWTSEDGKLIWWPNPHVGYAYHLIGDAVRQAAGG